MKNILTILFISIGMMSFAQCNLNISWTSNVAGGNITFTNTSTGVPSSPQFAWLYDGQSSSLENPTFPYDSSISQVCFAIYSLDTLCSDSICGPVGSPPCTLNISWVSCVGGGNIGFNSNSTGVPTNAAYAWLYNGQSSSLADPIFTYDPAATDVCLAIYDIDNPSCQDSICGPINDSCNACNLNISWTSSVNGNSITFTNTSTGEPANVSYAWLYNGQSSSLENPTFPYDSTMSQVCFAINDLTGGNCDDSICGPVNIVSTGCNLNINWVSGLNGGNIDFYNTSTGMPQNPYFYWSYGTQSSSNENPSFVYDSTASFVCLTISDSVGICSDTVCGPMNFDSTATVIEIPQLDVNVYPNPFNNELNVIVSDYSDLSVMVTDLSGRILFQQTMTGNQEILQLDDLDTGGYLLYIIDPQDQNKTTVRKILKL